MGLIDRGILGGFRKKTGTVVGAFWRTLETIRAMPRLSGKPQAQSIINQQIKFALITNFLSYISDLVQTGYKLEAKIQTAMNVAVADNLKNAIQGVAPDFSIKYAGITFSKGKIDKGLGHTVASMGQSKVDITWDDYGASAFCDPTDMVTILVYNPTHSNFVRLIDAAPRSAKQFSIQMPLAFTGDEVHCYMSFNSKLKAPMVSDSVYVGHVLVV